MIVAERPAEQPPPLRMGDTLRCPFPGCGERRPEWDWPRLRVPGPHRHELNPVLRCPRCARHFSPRGVTD
jgi:hypothetical protein